MSVELDVSLWKSTSKIGVKFLLIFFFFINFFMKTLIKSIIYCQTVPLERLLMYIVNILFQVSLPLFLTKVRLAIFCFRSMINGNCWFSSASLSLVGKKSLVPELRVMGVAVELHVNATYCVQHLAMKSVYLWTKPVICGNL